MKAEGGHGRTLKRQGRPEDRNKGTEIRGPGGRGIKDAINMRQADSRPHTRTHSTFAKTDCAEILKHTLFSNNSFKRTATIHN